MKDESTTFSVRMPNSIKRMVKSLAKKQKRSANNFMLVSIKKEIINSQIYEAKHENIPSLGQD
jgi:predicted transcriptional regulator